jgi:hypothetical protein
LGKYDNTLAIEVIWEEDDLNYMYIWNKQSKQFFKLSEINWNNLKSNLEEHYFPYSIYSGNKKIYLDGIHIPVEVFSQVTGVEFKKGKFIEYTELPLEFKTYIAHITPNLEENTEEELENLKYSIDNKVKELIQLGTVSNKDKRASIAPCQFIREI